MTTLVMVYCPSSFNYLAIFIVVEISGSMKVDASAEKIKILIDYYIEYYTLLNNLQL